MTRVTGIAARLERLELDMSLACLLACQQRQPERHAVSKPVAGGQALFFGSGSPLSQALSLGLNGPVSDAEIDELEDFYRERNCAVTISLCPDADATLVEALGSRGYRVTHFEHTMARTLRETQPDPPGDGIQVRLAAAEDSTTWGRVLQEGFFGGPAPGTEGLFEAVFHAPGAASFLCEYEGKPGAAAMMFVSKNGALFACDATLSGCRGRGMQSALIFARVNQAREAGCELAAASTMPGSASQRNYERAGFRVVYTKAMMQKT